MLHKLSSKGELGEQENRQHHCYYYLFIRGAQAKGTETYPRPPISTKQNKNKNNGDLGTQRGDRSVVLAERWGFGGERQRGAHGAAPLWRRGIAWLCDLAIFIETRGKPAAATIQPGRHAAG